MALIKKKPITPSLRFQILLNREVQKIKKLKKYTILKKNNAGRNNKGRMTFFTKGGGHKRNLRKITFKYPFLKGFVESIEYDPNRKANIARIYDQKTNKHYYILAPQGLLTGHFIKSHLIQKEKSFSIGNSISLQEIPLGMPIYNIDFPKGKGALIRSAGTFANIISKNEKYCRIRVASGEHRIFSLNTIVNIGIVSNSQHQLINLGKAGRSR